MQREIKFRGKRIDNNKWVYGSLVNNGFFNSETKESIPYIFNTEERDNAYGWEDFDDDYGYYQVKPESIGQFTGLTDKNGKEIYEGDLVIGNTSYERPDDEREWEENDPCLVEYSKTECGFYPFTLNARWRCDVENIKVIGNIHEQK